MVSCRVLLTDDGRIEERRVGNKVGEETCRSEESVSQGSSRRVPRGRANSPQEQDTQDRREVRCVHTQAVDQREINRRSSSGFPAIVQDGLRIERCRPAEEVDPAEQLGDDDEEAVSNHGCGVGPKCGVMQGPAPRRGGSVRGAVLEPKLCFCERRSKRGADW